MGARRSLLLTIFVLFISGCRGGEQASPLPPEASHMEQSAPIQPAPTAAPAPPPQMQRPAAPPRPAMRPAPQPTANSAPPNGYDGNNYALSMSDYDFVLVENSRGALDLNKDFTIELWLGAHRAPGEVAGDMAWNSSGQPKAVSGWALRGVKTPEGYRMEFTVVAADGQLITLPGVSANFGRDPHHVAVCRAGDELRMFIDGKSTSKQNASQPLASGPGPIFLGVAGTAPEGSRVRANVHSFHVSSVARYGNDFQPSLFTSDDQSLVLLDFGAGNTDDLSGHGRSGKCYGPEWMWMTLDESQPVKPFANAQQTKKVSRASLREAYAAYSATGASAAFNEQLQTLHQQFPLIEPAKGDEAAKWTTVTLNKSGDQLDAIRFKSPLGEPAGMRWAFVAPVGRLASWYILPVKGAMAGFQQYDTELFVDFENLSEPADNVSFFQTLAAGIKPGQEYILWFTFHSEEPVELSAAIQLAPAKDGDFPFSAEETARKLGFTTPFARTSLPDIDALAARSRHMETFDLEGAMAITDEGLAKYPDSRPLLLAAIFQKSLRARQIASRAGNKFAAPKFLEIGELGRRLKSKIQDPTREEKDGLIAAAYLEACGHASLGDSAKAVGSLRDAVQAGFAKPDELATDERLAALRGLPEFDKLIADLRAAAP
jgi:hypothetical protein